MNPNDVYNQRIFDNNVPLNGRVNIIEPEVPDIVFKMQERIAVKNKTTEYRGALSGIQEDNLLSKLFFSIENIQIIQNALRAGVYYLSNEKYVVPPQNMDVLKVVMRSIYLQYSEHKENSKIKGEIEKLNKLVLNYCIPTVYSEAVGYEKYLYDQSTLVVPLELPRHHDRQYKQLQLKRWF